jgi:transcriptional regulator with XRE-family HTH domain
MQKQRTAEKDKEECGRRLKQLRENKGLTQSQLGHMVGTVHQQIQKLEKGTLSVSVEWAKKIAPFLDVSPIELLGISGEIRQTASLVGYVGAGLMYYADPRVGPWNTIEEVEAPPGAEGLKAVRVQGDALEPIYGNGDILYFGKTKVHPSSCLGKECVIQILNGPAMVRKIKSFQNGTYILEWHGVEVIKTADIEWALPVLWVRRAQEKP